MDTIPPRQSALRRGRVSMPGAVYFLTICAQRPCNSLASDEMFRAMLAKFAALEAPDAWRLLAIQLMPDHLHVLGRLGTVQPLAEVVRRFKGSLTPILRTRSITWQPGGYFDHRLRDDDELAPTLRYMLTNPYRKGLVDWGAVWPYWHCAPEVWAWFGPATCDGRPLREWVRETSPGRTAP